MNTESVKTVPGKHLLLLDELQTLLDDQMARVRKGDFKASEALAEKSGRIVDELGKIDALQQSEFREQFERLIKSYRTVILSVAAEKDRLERQFQQIGRARKTLRKYRRHD